MDRRPAVSGFFYPSDKGRLRDLLSEMDQSVEAQHACTKPIGVLVPHAGIIYSGKTAMHSYKILRSSTSRRFVIVGPNHASYPPFAASYPGRSWVTPFGSARIDSELRELISSNSSVIRDDEAAHSVEHSVEVQLPFLQYLFGTDFTFYPIILGDQSMEAALEISEILSRLGDDVTFIFSSDLTHYEQYFSARKKDLELIEIIRTLDIREFYRKIREDRVSACGYGAIAIMMNLTRMKGGDLTLLDYSTSGDTGGDKSSVVGYSSMVSCP